LKSLRHKKLLGLALGEKSLLAAELTAGQQPRVTRLAEMAYPAEATLSQPAELGAALARFLQDKQFTARAAVIGIPAKWLLVKTKEVPSAKSDVLANMLRLQAETEFSRELKDLVYDYSEAPVHQSAAGGEIAAPAQGGRSVLLLATPRKQIEWVQALCLAAKIRAVAVMPSALALGHSTGAADGQASEKETLVLTVGEGGSEMTAQRGHASSAIRHLRPLEPRSPFFSELRRTISTLPPVQNPRQLVLWDGAGLDADSLSEQLGLPVRGGNLRSLGVDPDPAGSNGQANKFAPAVALAMTGFRDNGPRVDFLHSRLAPPKERRIPRWTAAAVAAVVIAIAGAIYAYNDLQARQAQLATLQATVAAMQGQVDQAKQFVDKVDVAQGWHAGQPRYLECLRDLTQAIPEDGQTYATNLTLKEQAPPSGATGIAKYENTGILVGELDGKTTSRDRVISINDRMIHNPAFTNVILQGTTNIPRSSEVSFDITFTYNPAKWVP
jgi:hypothetical protein